MLTRKQLEFSTSSASRIEAEGVPPSFDEMKEALGLKSKSGIHRLITALEERGFIRRMAHRARALEIVKLPEAMEKPGFSPRVIAGDKPDAPRPAAALPVEAVDALDIPLMGRIAAGVPIEAIAHVSRHVAVPGALMSGQGQHYALEVKGNSMIEAGINDGDIVVIREQIHRRERRHRRGAGRGCRGDAEALSPPRQHDRAGSRQPGLRDPGLSRSHGAGAGSPRRADPQLLEPPPAPPSPAGTPAGPAAAPHPRSCAPGAPAESTARPSPARRLSAPLSAR